MQTIARQRQADDRLAVDDFTARDQRRHIGERHSFDDHGLFLDAHRACRDLGVKVAVVYSEADRDAPYLDLADQAVCIGPGVATQSYLYPPRIIAAAEGVEADAIHPGYGFLSENANFAQMCRDNNFEFVGPPA